jgi:hypothetical protein
MIAVRATVAGVVLLLLGLSAAGWRRAPSS